MKLTQGTASRSGMYQKLDRFELSVFTVRVFLLNFGRETDQISHNLTCNIAPADKNTSGTHGIPFLLTAMVCAATSHQSLTAFIRPCHDLTDRLGALGQTIHYSNELDLEQLHQVLVTTIANQSTLVANRFKIYFLPRPAHLS